jgi:DNA-directed RNA polymerase sigma subunit (sigma70/sigma32)
MSIDQPYLDRVIEQLEEFCRHYKQKELRVKQDFSLSMLMDAARESDCTDRQLEICLTVWGVYTGKPLTYKAAGEKMGVSGSRVTQVEQRALHHILRQYWKLMDCRID